jgi:hypothetical protein
MLEVEPKIRRGAETYRAFWRAFPNLLSAEQKTAAANNKLFLLLQLDLRSDPEFAFNSYVLRHLAPR